MNATRIGEEGHVQFEDYGLILFVGLSYYLFCKFDDGFKVWIVLLGRLRDRSQCLAHGVAHTHTKPATKRERKNTDIRCQGVRKVCHRR